MSARIERTTNSALRLHRLLLALRAACRDGRPIRDALAEVFDLDPADDLALRRRLVQLDDLFEQSQAAIAAIPGLDPPRYLRYFPAARKGLLAARLDQDSRRYAPFQEGLSDIVLQSVEFCGVRIAEEFPELLLSTDDLADLEARLNDVFAFTAKAELDPPLRMIALDILQSPAPPSPTTASTARAACKKPSSAPSASSPSTTSAPRSKAPPSTSTTSTGSST